MVKVEVYHLSLFQAEIFNKAGISHGFSTRVGGYSEGPYQGLNLKLPVAPHEDKAFAVLENRRLLAEKLGCGADDFVACQQIHGDTIYKVTAQDKGRGAHQHLEGIPDTDGLITNEAGIPLMIQVADCVPILFAAPEAGVIGAAHAGWRGTEQKILQKMVRCMVSEYGVEAQDILVAIGPCIGFEQFEVGTEVAQAFASQIDLNHADLARAQGDKYFLNLQKINRLQALNAGIPPNQIELLPHCTYSESELFFSYRRDQGVTGRQVGVIYLKP